MVKSSARSSARNNQESQYVLKASVNDVRMLAGMLRPISVSPQATFRMSQLGVEVSTEAHRAVVAKAWIMKDLFTSYSFNPPGSDRRKRKKAKLLLDNKQKDAREVSVSSEAKFDEFLNRQSNDGNGINGDIDRDPTSSDIAKLAFGASSENSGDSLRRRNENEREAIDQDESNLQREEEDEPYAEEKEEDSDLPTSLETDLNLNHFIECLDIFGGAPALKGPTGSRSDSTSGGKNEEDDLITEEFRRRARERREREGQGQEGSPERRHQSGGKTSKEDKDRTALRMSWKGHGHPFVLLLEEQNVVTRCELSTIETYEIRDLGFSSSEDVAKAIINSEWLQSAFSSVDPSASSLSILFSPSYRPVSTFSMGLNHGLGKGTIGPDETIDDTTMTIREGNEDWMNDDDTSRRRERERENSKSKSKSKKKESKRNKPIQMLRLSADGDFGSSVIELPVDPAVVFEFNCQYETENKYNFNHLSHLLKALSASTKVAIRVNEIGCAVFQFLMPKGTAGNESNTSNGGSGGDNSGCGFVDFYILPLEQIALEDQEEDGNSTSSD